MITPIGSPSPERILAILGPSCRDNARRQLLLGQNTVHGIDYIEFDEVLPTPTLHVHFLYPLPAGAWGLVADHSRILIHGGTRIVGVKVTNVKPPAGQVLDIE